MEQHLGKLPKIRTRKEAWPALSPRHPPVAAGRVRRLVCALESTQRGPAVGQFVSEPAAGETDLAVQGLQGGALVAGVDAEIPYVQHQAGGATDSLSIPHAVKLRQFLGDVCLQGRSFAPPLPRKGGNGQGIAGHAGPVTGRNAICQRDDGGEDRAKD